MRNRYASAAMVFAFALVISLIAAGQSSTTNSQTQPGVETPSQSTAGSTGAQAQSPDAQSAPQARPEPGQASPGSQSGGASPQGHVGADTQNPADSSAQSSSQGSSQNAPAGQSGSSSSAQSGQAGGQPRTVEDELQLTDEQKAKLQPIIQEEMTQIQAVRNDNSMTMDQKIAKVRQIKQAEFPKIQAILTPEQQKKLADMQDRARQQQGSGNQSTPPNGSQGQQPPK